MAIAKVQYKENASATPDVWMDTTQKTVTSGSMLSGTTALKNDGTGITGNIASKSSSDLTASGATVTAPAGYYASAASKSVASGSAGTPTASKGTVSNHSVSVTPSVTNTTGYITGGTKTGTAVTVNVTELESGTKSITENGTGISVSGYSAVDVAVPSQAPTGVKYIYTGIDGDGAWDVSGYEYCSVDGAPLSDGHLRIWIDLTSITDSLSTSIVMGMNREQGSYSIDWGDGSTPDSVSTTAFTNTTKHTYNAAGLYVIDITLTSGKLQLFNFRNEVIQNALYIEARGLNPQVVNNSQFPAVTNAQLLKGIWFGDEITTPGSISNNVSLNKIRLSTQQTSIQTTFLYGNSSLQNITIPASVTSIGSEAFANCTSLQEIHFLSVTPPTLSGTESSSPFYNTPSSMVIYVPSTSLSAYQSATNWSAYASKMVGE